MRNQILSRIGVLLLLISCAGCGAGEGGIKPDDIQIRMRYQIALRGQDYYMLLPGSRIVQGVPSGGLDALDVEKICAANPDNCGTYTLKDGQMTITWGG